MSHTLSVTNQALPTNSRGGTASSTTITCYGIGHIATAGSGTGPIATPPPCRAYALRYSDVSPEIAEMSYKYIGAVLDRHRVNGSYGALIAVKEGDGFAPAIRFGIPGGGRLGLTPPSQLPVRVFVVDDQMVAAAGVGYKGLLDSGSLGIGKISIGGEGDMENFGSFACFLSDPKGRQYGLTASHVLPSGSSSNNTKVVSPSTKEITDRMQVIIKYTKFCPPKDRLHIRPAKEQEAEDILTKYATILCSTGGVEIQRDPAYPVERVAFCGRVEGNAVFSVFTEETGVLDKHNTYLSERGLPLIHLPPEGAEFGTCKDIALFNLVKAGENTIPGGGDIDGWIYAGSGTCVRKIGRSTGNTVGEASAGAVITWQDGRKTIELSIAMPQVQFGDKFKSFAEGGDSGAILFTKTDSEKLQFKAVGLLHGRSLDENDLSVYTPMWAVKKMVAQGMGGGFEISAGQHR